MSESNTTTSTTTSTTTPSSVGNSSSSSSLVVPFSSALPVAATDGITAHISDVATRVHDAENCLQQISASREALKHTAYPTLAEACRHMQRLFQDIDDHCVQMDAIHDDVCALERFVAEIEEDHSNKKVLKERAASGQGPSSSSSSTSSFFSFGKKKEAIPTTTTSSSSSSVALHVPNTIGGVPADDFVAHLRNHVASMASNK
eukprot:PhM_4_TR7092/c0_g1_i1/m.1823